MMEIKQKPNFEPITITLNAPDEAKDFLALIDWNGEDSLTKRQIDLAVAISNWFSNEAKL